MFEAKRMFNIHVYALPLAAYVHGIKGNSFTLTITNVKRFLNHIFTTIDDQLQ